jgi:hypothetical protein
VDHPFVLRKGRFGIGDTRKPSSFDTLDVLCDTLYMTASHLVAYDVFQAWVWTISLELT